MVLLHWQWFSKPMETMNNFPGWNSRDYCVNQDLTGYRWHSNWDMGRALLINEQLWARCKDTMMGNVARGYLFPQKTSKKTERRKENSREGLSGRSNACWEHSCKDQAALEEGNQGMNTLTIGTSFLSLSPRKTMHLTPAAKERSETQLRENVMGPPPSAQWTKGQIESMGQTCICHLHLKR